MKRTVKFGNATIFYTIVKSNRRKTSQITVDKNSVVVRTPISKTLPEIREIVDAKKQWIFRKQLEFQKRKSDLPRTTFAQNSKILYLGKEFTLKILKNRKTESVMLKKDTITISIKSSRSSKTVIKKMYQEWVMKKAIRLFKIRIVKYSKKLNLKPEKINVKDLKDRWGSATSDNAINLNVNLIKAPTQIIDYVILHELCHLKIKGHSDKFWNMIKRFMPNYEEQKLWLELNNVIVS